MIRFIPVMVLLTVLCASQSAIAVGVFDFSIPKTNQNPFVQIHGLPGYSNSQVLNKSQSSTQVQFTVTNEFHQQNYPDQRIFLDYEQTRLAIAFEYGIADEITAGIVVPFLVNSSGFTDGLIEGWHDVFGLPQGGRDDAPRNKFLISYQRMDESFEIDTKNQGIGDISLFLDKQLINQHDLKLKTRTKLKLPTGDDTQLFGSGGYGLSVAVNGSRKLIVDWHAYGAIGLGFLEKGNVLPTQQKSYVGTATLGIIWHVNQKFGISTQLDFNSKVYSGSDLDVISGQAGVLNVAASYKISDNMAIQAGFSEDAINKHGAPDIGFNLSLKYLN